MGVPAFFRWLSKKYPSIVVECDDGVKGKADFDNLYLDMNGIIHPCSHPEYKAAPETEEEMFVAIFEYIERIMSIVRPKKLLYMAVDGCAPRAKMNQQRSRRFRASQESIDRLLEIQKIKEEMDGCAPRAKMNQQRSRRFRASQESIDRLLEIQKIKEELRGNGIEVKDKPKEAHFDSNVITPGTQFMINLSHALRQWIDEKLSADNEDRDGIWPKDMMVILSDASVPGEGEHKIMEYIRKQKAQSATYDPNLSHCLYGADADLIMLGLSTHELNFTILREEFKPNQPKPCDICGQLGHDMKECLGTERPPDEEPSILPTEPEFIYIRLCVLREYLQKEATTCAVHLDLERFIDDFVFLCFFVGNDFLPHLPSLEIRENAIDRLISIYKENATKYPNPDNPYLTKDGSVFMERVQYVLQELGEAEDQIFKQRQENEIRFQQRRKRQKLQNRNLDSRWTRPEAVARGSRPQVFDNTRNEAYSLRVGGNDNLSAAQKLKAMLRDGQSGAPTTDANPQDSENASNKRKRESGVDSDSEPEDLVQLFNDGWKERYYYHKFDCNSTSISEISSMVAREYIIGLSWVLLYYYQGCPDWKWFYPFHYAPFASDFKEIAKVEVKFDRTSQPFNPLEQLMSVFPAASSQNLPPTWRSLMSDTKSSIIDFYPNTFKIDLNGKKAAWMGVALLPFIDENRLFNALKKVYSNLTEAERERNARGNHLIFVAKIQSDFSDFSKEVVESSAQSDVHINPDLFRGISGTLSKSEKYSPAFKRVYCSVYKDPVYDPDFIFPAIRLEKAIPPQFVLKPEDLEKLERYNWRPTPQQYNSYYRPPNSYQSNQNNYRSADSSSHQNSYRTSDTSQQYRSDDHRQQNRYSDYRQGNQSNSYETNRLMALRPLMANEMPIRIKALIEMIEIQDIKHRKIRSKEILIMGLISKTLIMALMPTKTDAKIPGIDAVEAHPWLPEHDFLSNEM
ncbi:unnamed protein product [Oppiella nova]|uniref:5'-3' exoribonuclease n=1 Tax=Oppiella nova TaxID=334625 RepID=A0A7R9LRE4_9ACAR|nr:unnamed protein product [Oppiella nova]CAG2166163.1 unnamed protein product [Oppiella nova]